MESTRVNLIENCLVFYKNDEVFYHLREFDLKEIRVINSKEVSACIIDLSQKTWVTISLLYLVAKLIEDNYPAIKMNWENTFCHIECSDFVKSAGGIVNLANFEEKGDVAKTSKEILVARRTPEIERREIRDIINSNLKDYELLN